MQKNKKKFPIPNVVYSVASKGAGWLNMPFATGKNKIVLEELRRKLLWQDNYYSQKGGV